MSTDYEEQQLSYESQVKYYTDYIKKNKDFELFDIYADEGISGTSTKNRTQFNRMICDCLDGKIDLVLTKSISRFARNTVDSLEYIRKLKEKGVAVYFEKENINTLDPNGDLLITILSGLAQEESRSISTNCKWGFKRKFENGEILLATSRFLGYGRDKENNIVIIKEEAEVVNEIYKLYLSGFSLNRIKKYLEDREIKTPMGKTIWSTQTISSILKNEKYAGNAILQKTYSVDFISKKRKINNGEIQKYYVENSHPAIVSKDVWEEVQKEREKRQLIKKKSRMDKNENGKYSSKYALSELIFCGECGKNYKRQVWHSYTPKREVWRCINRLENGKKYCKGSITIDEKTLHDVIKSKICEFINNNEYVISETFKNINTVLEKNEKAYTQTHINFDKYNDSLVKKIVEKITVIDKNTIHILFKNGEKIKVDNFNIN